MGRQPIGHHAETHLPQGEDPIPGLQVGLHTLSAFENATAFPGPQSVAAGALTSLAFAHERGGVLLDYTTPTVPKFLTDGVYGLTVCVIGEAAVTSINHFSIRLFVSGVAAGTIDLVQDVHSNDLSQQTSGVVSFPGAELLAGDSFDVQIRNSDTAARNFDCFYMWVSRILVAF